MTSFVETEHCVLEAHCTLCRAFNAGHSWRASLAKVFELPPGAPDFACPHGKPWGWTAEPGAVVVAHGADFRPPGRVRRWLAGWRRPSRGLGDTIAKLTGAFGIQPCGGCKGRQSWCNRTFPYSWAVWRERARRFGFWILDARINVDAE